MTNNWILCITLAGGEQYGCSVNTHLWLYYSLNIQKTPETFCDNHFYSKCNDAIKARFGIDVHDGVNHTNWDKVYRYLKNCIQ